jgi:hypothetical protein
LTIKSTDITEQKSALFPDSSMVERAAVNR